MLSDDEIVELLEKSRTRRSGLKAINIFLGRPEDYVPPPPSKRMRRKWRREARRDRIRRAWQILRYGSYEGEGDW